MAQLQIQFKRLILLGLLFTLCIAENHEAETNDVMADDASGSDWIYMHAPNTSSSIEARAINNGFAASGANSAAGPGGSFASSFAASGVTSQSTLLSIQRNCGIIPQLPPSPHGSCAPGEYPWMVAIFTWDNRFLSSGILISDSIVLTAAGPIVDYARQNQPLKVRLGAYAVPEHDPNVLPQREVYVSAASIDPHFNENSNLHNLALLRLTININFDKFPHVFPICISQLQNDYVNPATCKMLSWPNLRPDWRGPPTFLSQEPVQTALEGCPNQDLNSACAQGALCRGNPGSPIICEVGDGRYFLWGIVGGNGFCDGADQSPSWGPVIGIYSNLGFITRYTVRV